MILEPNEEYVFTLNNFQKNYFDKEGDLPNEIWILSLPIYGTLKYNNELVEINDIIKVENLDKLTYTRVSNDEYQDEIQFKISDKNPNKLFSKMATFTISVDAYVNLPPVIGDNSITIGYATTKVFTVSDFTSNTTPPYADPEGDGPSKLKILSLPSKGFVKLSGINVTVNQEILFTSIASGLLTYVSDNTDEDGYNIDFDFAISDLGSGQFST